MKNTFTNKLKSLMLGGALALSAGAASNAAASASTTPAADDSSLDQRVAKVRQALDNQPNGGLAKSSGGERGGAGTLWWRNGWGNGGYYHRWGNGGGWGNGWRNGWRNGGPWANIRL